MNRQDISIEHLTMKSFFGLDAFYSSLSADDKRVFHPSFFQGKSSFKWFLKRILLFFSSIKLTRLLFARILSSKYYLFFVALNSRDEVVGVCYVFVRGRKGDCGIAVDSAHRRVGLGKKLLEMLITESFGIVDTIELSVHVDNAEAISFYEKMGFNRVNESVEADSWGGESLPCYVMRLDL